MNRTALSLAIFGTVFLLLIGIALLRSKRLVAAVGEPSDTTIARKKANRLTLSIVAIVVLGSWIGAAVIYLQGVDIPHVSIQIILASITAICWLIMLVAATWKLRQLSEKLELAGGNDATLLQAIKELRARRIKFILIFGLFVFASALGMLGDFLSSALKN